MVIYRMVVAYDGTAYHGWQLQPNATTISSVLIDTFFQTFSHKIILCGASRTDAGVHAEGQVAIIQSPVSIPAKKMEYAWNNALPHDILIKSIEKLPALIHPHDGVMQKTYYYHIFTERPMPFVQRYGWYYKRPIDFELLHQALQLFVGTHDFRSFCTGDDMDSTIRTIDSIDISYIKEWNAYRIEFKAKGFLRYMVRRLVGAALEIASRDHLSLDNLQNIFQACNPCHTLPNAPGKGLVLHQISYEGKRG